MKTTKKVLEEIDRHLDESIGNTPFEMERRSAPSAKDVGRKPIRGFGEIPVQSILPDPNQPRSEFDREELDHLARSISQKQLSPIRVRWSEKHNRWVIIAGERRWRAAKLAGKNTIECFFHEEELTKSEIIEEQLIENIHRNNLKPIEEARGFAKLMSIIRLFDLC